MQQNAGCRTKWNEVQHDMNEQNYMPQYGGDLNKNKS
jgi:hypothetical protein